jgi:hypothetical protein
VSLGKYFLTFWSTVIPSSSGLTSDIEGEGTAILQNIMYYLLIISAHLMPNSSAVGISNLISTLMVLCLLSTNYAKL